MIVEYDYSDLCNLLGFHMEKQELLDALAMYGTPPEGLGKAEVFPNRPDMLSVEGISRALKGFIGIETGMKQYPVFQSGISVKVNDISLSEIRPFCSFAVVDRVALDDFSLASMMQLQEKLHTTHGRRRRKASIGIYDLGTVTPPLTYGALEPDRIEFVPLESEGTMSAERILSSHPKGREYRHLLEGLPRYPVLVDSKGRFLSMAPIINSDDAKVTPATKSIFIDATGWDQTAVDEAVRIMATSIAERFPKSRIGTVDVDCVGGRTTPDMAPRTMRLDAAYCNRLLGVPLSSEKMAECLKKMRFDAAVSSGDISVSIPQYRTDIMHQIDLVEDVAIAFGYGNFPPTIPAMPNIGCELPESGVSSAVRGIMTGLGFTEAFTFVLSNPKKLFGNMMAQPRQSVAAIANPKTADFTLVRDSILPGLMEVLGYNAHQPYPQRFFELGEVVNVSNGNGNGEARNEKTIAGVIAHSQAGYSEVKSVVEAIFRMTGAIRLGEEMRFIEMSDAPWFIKGRGGSMSGESPSINAEFGEIHPQVLEKWGIGVPVTAFELKFL